MVEVAVGLKLGYRSLFNLNASFRTNTRRSRGSVECASPVQSALLNPNSEHTFHGRGALGGKLQRDAAGPVAAGTGNKPRASVQVWEKTVRIRSWAGACSSWGQVIGMGWDRMEWNRIEYFC